jgi:UDP:flavonoid glycosyltransferase YjiC (YdhE family)
LRIVIPVTGSRGDVQPYVALGKGFHAAGHEVRVATHLDFAPAVREHGLDFFAIAADSRALHSTDAARRMNGAGRNPFAYVRELVRLREPLMQELMARCSAACRDRDFVLLTPTTLLLGLSAAEKWRLPACIASFQPTSPSRHVANCLFPELPRWVLGRGSYNYLTHLLAGGALWWSLRPHINKARREVLDLPPFPLLGPPVGFFEKTPTLAGYSPRVLPPPPDWGDNIYVTGYWFLDAPGDWRPPAALCDFLESGPPPVCVGFGSMSGGDAEQATDVVSRALAATGRRAVLLTGWGALASRGPSDRVFVTEAVPHDWLYPRTAGVVHHGGAGTTAAALRAGVPALVVPFAGDQFLWGRRVFTLGVGPRPIPRWKLSAEALADGLRTLAGDEAMRRRAADLGAAIRAEDGVGRAVRLVSSLVDGGVVSGGVVSSEWSSPRLTTHHSPLTTHEPRTGEVSWTSSPTPRRLAGGRRTCGRSSSASLGRCASQSGSAGRRAFTGWRSVAWSTCARRPAATRG